MLEYIKKGYNFVITLDDTLKSADDVEKLRMFKLVIVPSDLKLYKEIKRNDVIVERMK